MNPKPEEEMTPYELKQQKARTIFQQMQETIRANQAKFLNRIGQKEVKKKMYEKATFDLDASIEEEASKRLPKIKLSPIPKQNHPLENLGALLENEPEENLIEETTEEVNQEVVEEEKIIPVIVPVKAPVFVTPDPAETNLDDLIDALEVISKYLNNAKNEATILEEDVHNADYETSDFLHSIELSDFDEMEKADVFDKMREIRQRRRSYKIRLEYMKELNTFIEKNVNITNRINSLRGQLKRIKEKQKTARFFSRVRTDIKEDDRVHIGHMATNTKGI